MSKREILGCGVDENRGECRGCGGHFRGWKTDNLTRAYRNGENGLPANLCGTLRDRLDQARREDAVSAMGVQGAE